MDTSRAAPQEEMSPKTPAIPSASCVICFTQTNESDRADPCSTCGVIFHEECLRLWLKRNPTCPTCRSAQSKESDPGSSAWGPLFDEVEAAQDSAADETRSVEELPLEHVNLRDHYLRLLRATVVAVFTFVLCYLICYAISQRKLFSAFLATMMTLTLGKVLDCVRSPEARRFFGYYNHRTVAIYLLSGSGSTWIPHQFRSTSVTPISLAQPTSPVDLT